MSTKHTPGPWRLGHKTTKTKGFMILGGHNREVANVYQRPDYMPEERETDLANARLIAAAPDLLEALKALEMTTRILPRDMDEPGSALAMAVAAIKKAEA